jgi:hypothetical protein
LNFTKRGYVFSTHVALLSCFLLWKKNGTIHQSSKSLLFFYLRRTCSFFPLKDVCLRPLQFVDGSSPTVSIDNTSFSVQQLFTEWPQSARYSMRQEGIQRWPRHLSFDFNKFTIWWHFSKKIWTPNQVCHQETSDLWNHLPLWASSLICKMWL